MVGQVITVEPCSSTAGFFQLPPKLRSAFDEDTSLRRLLDAFLPPVVQERANPELAQLAAKVVTSEILEDVATADRTRPYVKTWDTWGNRVDKVVTSDSWKRLRQLAIREGLVSIPYEEHLGPHGRIVQLAKLNLFSGSAAAVTFYTAFADGAAYLLQQHLSSPRYDAKTQAMFQYAYQKVISRQPDNAWAAGLFMTERSGGSDVQGLETLAFPVCDEVDGENSARDADGFELGPWSIHGFKWFSSGTESEIAFILARTEKGISLFYAPLYRQTTNGHGDSVKVLNGVKIQRLKHKIGTHPKTTAELEFDGVRAWLIGKEGEGIKEVVHVLNIGRLHVGISALGLWSRGLGVVKSFSRMRKSGKRELTEIPMYVHGIARMHVEYRGQLILMLFVGALLGRTEHPDTVEKPQLAQIIPDSTDEVHLLVRLLTPITKVLSVKYSIEGLLRCMTALGGVGFLENEETEFNIARLYRDATMHVVLDGTPEALTNEVIRVLKGKTGAPVIAALDKWIKRMTPQMNHLGDETAELQARWELLKSEICQLSPDELLVDGHDIVERLGALVSGYLLVADANRDADEIALEIAVTWIRLSHGATGSKRAGSVKEGLLRDRRIIFGPQV